jgi:hypothetical protein
MGLDSLWQSLQASALGTYIAESTWAFPTFESIHVIAIVTVVGTIAVVDLRLLGVTARYCPITVLSNDTLKWTWGAFVLAAITGGLLFVSKATSYMANPYFLTKMGLLILAALNMGYFHFFTQKSIKDWDLGVVPPAAKAAGMLSLIFWVGVVFCGRVIGFTLGIY